MTSVWKRLQRVGKKASKFQFSASYQSLTVECIRGGKWQPNKLVVVWTRRKRRKLTKPMSWQPGISNPFRGIIVWSEPDPVDITVTLYKDSKPDSVFEDKEWTFVIEDESQTGRRKPLATGAINMVDYVSVENRTFDITLTMKVASKKLVSASLEFTLSCVLIKEGMATDDDMISIGSMMSLNDSYYLDDNDDDLEVAPSPRIRHKRNLTTDNITAPPVIKVQDSADGRMESPTASPIHRRSHRRIRSKSALGENAKTLLADVQKAEAAKRLSTGSDVSSEISDCGQEVTKDKSKMESELIKWTRSRTKGYRGVKVKNMTTTWRDGLAFCAILHSFHPDKIDFSSLDPHNIKDNNKLAFSAFEKLGIPRLLDPTQMMFSPVPDKLSVMTYVFQIKTYFSRPPALPPSPFSLKTPASRPRHAPPPPPPPPPPKVPVASKGEPIDLADVSLACNSSDIDNSGEGKGKDEGYIPFLDDDEEVQMDSIPEVSTDPSATTLSVTNETSTCSIEKETALDSSSSSSESKHLIQESQSKESDAHVRHVMKPPPKPPRLNQTTDSPSVDTKTKSTELVGKKNKSESKGYNPFDDDGTDQEVVSNKKSTSPSKARKPQQGYNPFDDDEGDADVDSQDQTKNDKEAKHGHNPFDDDDDADVTQTEKGVDQKVGKREQRKKKISYPHIFNPFEDDDDDDDVKTDENAQRRTSKGIKNDKGSSAKSFNPFDDDNGDEGVSNDAGQSESSTRKSSLENKGKVGLVTQSGKASPSGLTKSPVANAKKRQAPPPPAVRSSDDPWTARLPDDVVIRRRRGPRPPTPGGSEQTSPQTSPARRGPKRTAPTPPRRPPLIPSFDEWKTDRGATGDNERSAGSSSVENTPSKKVSSEKEEETRTSADDSDSTSPKVSRTDGANQPDIKQLARQVLMDARKKAGASGALPRERVAEIAKTAKGPAADKTSADSITSEDGAQAKEKVDNQEAIKRKENLRLRKEELQRRKKANEKAQKMVQNAIEKEKGQKLASSAEPTTVEKKTQQSADTTDDNSDQKPVKNKNLQHRPLKLRDKENESHKRRPSTENDAKSAPDKAGFKESEELQRIRQILNQGKKDKKPSNSEHINQENGTVKTQRPETSQESKRKISDNKLSKRTAVNGLTDSPQPTPPPRPKVRGPNAGLHDYVESRKMNFEVFEVPPVRDEQGNEQEEKGTGSVDMTDGQTKDHEDSSIASDEQESEDQTREFQDTSEYVRKELKSLEEQQVALDKVGEKLEIELRRAMECKGCEEEQEKLMQDWFLLVNKKNELVRRQAELNLLKNEEDLERSHDMLQRELRALLEMEDWQKTEKQREREAELIEQLVLVVNKRDQLVQFEDSQLQQAEKDALHVQKVIDNVRISKDKNECVLQ